MAQEAPIQVSGLNHAFGKGDLRKQILFDITTEIPRGEIVIVTGPSGSGKTTMLTLIGALRSAQEGSVRVLGEELRGARQRTLEKVRRQIGFIFQQHNLLGALTSLQNVELGLRVSGRISPSELRRRSTEMLNAVGLGDRLHHKPEQLSGGQRQRVAIARALVSEPAILFADEPTASLDKQSGRDVVESMKTLAKEKGTTILLVTHDNRILDIADRIVHLEDGRLSAFTDAVIDNNQKMMRVMHDVPEQIPHGQLRADSDFQYMLVDISLQAQRLLTLEGKVNEMAYRSIVNEGINGFGQRLADNLGADSTLLLLADETRELLIPYAPVEAAAGGTVQIPSGTGIAGETLARGEPIRLDDVTGNPLYDAMTDGQLAAGASSLISIPVWDGDHRAFGVFQLHRHGGEAFSSEAEEKARRFVDTLGVLLETVYENV